MAPGSLRALPASLPAFFQPPVKLRRPAQTLAIACFLSLPLGAAAQEQAAPAASGPLLGPFAALRVAILPAQLWRADTAGWSATLSWADTRLALDSAITAELQERGLARRWTYAADVVRSAKRNPTYASDPYALGVGRWRSVAPKAGEMLSGTLSDNLRPLTALGDTRYALIPVELRAEGEAVVLRLVLADTRGRTVIWAGDLLAPGGREMITTLASRVADLIIEP